ncbi:MULTISPECIES: TetR/AcrR family transcriptional regulator [unclassified Streptomyces]|uniref:TetR/AcrR family transcriptional regulator n=1 Tax=unclassified Streptomyces TaxID=2593676 RepID=UPI0016620624|nr:MULTISPECIES: TetR/AcrR family transcriptional regulator [unclassified Streptomyces]MBD0841719.1 TetR/AcrR family transcriptional regulator [Streptomyces sp. TRM68416]
MKSRRTDGSASTPDVPNNASGSGTSSARRSRPKRARSGRRPGESGTREQILEAALHLFADRGYARTTIRAIAEDAKVDPALVHHFFTNKEGVFDAAVNSSFSVSTAFDGMPIADDAASETAWAVRTYYAFWENERTRYAMTAIYRAGLADSDTSQVLKSRIEASSRAWLSATGYKEREDFDIRSMLGSGHMIGLAILRYVLKVKPLADMEYEEFLSWVLPVLELRMSPELGPHKPERPAQD